VSFFCLFNVVKAGTRTTQPQEQASRFTPTAMQLTSRTVARIADRMLRSAQLDYAGVLRSVGGPDHSTQGAGRDAVASNT
jgi:hypothetical protein